MRIYIMIFYLYGQTKFIVVTTYNKKFVRMSYNQI